jgi:hypothetical protein
MEFNLGSASSVLSAEGRQTCLTRLFKVIEKINGFCDRAFVTSVFDRVHETDFNAGCLSGVFEDPLSGIKLSCAASGARQQKMVENLVDSFVLELAAEAQVQSDTDPGKRPV